MKWSVGKEDWIDGRRERVLGCMYAFVVQMGVLPSIHMHAPGPPGTKTQDKGRGWGDESQDRRGRRRWRWLLPHPHPPSARSQASSSASRVCRMLGSLLPLTDPCRLARRSLSALEPKGQTGSTGTRPSGHIHRRIIAGASASTGSSIRSCCIPVSLFADFHVVSSRPARSLAHFARTLKCSTRPKPYLSIRQSSFPGKISHPRQKATDQ